MRRARGGLAWCLIVLCLWAAPASASPEDLANEIAGQVMSPFCPGVTLASCPSDKAIALRDRIESWARDGWSESRIMSELVALYGEPIRALPPRDGSGLWAWLAPALGIAGGIALAGVLARRWSRRPARTSTGDPGTISPETRARIAEELDALRGRP